MSKDKLVEAFYQMGQSLHGERFLRDSKEVEFEFKSGDEIIKVVCPILKENEDVLRIGLHR